MVINEIVLTNHIQTRLASVCKLCLFQQSDIAVWIINCILSALNGKTWKVACLDCKISLDQMVHIQQCDGTLSNFYNYNWQLFKRYTKIQEKQVHLIVLPFKVSRH